MKPTLAARWARSLLPVVVCCGGICIILLVFGVGIGALMQQNGH